MLSFRHKNQPSKNVADATFKFQDYKNCLEVAQIENKINQLQEIIDSLIEDHKEFIKNNELILKTQQRFSEKPSFFTKEINKVTLSSNDDQRMRSID